jgi:hypothetical protein
LTVAAMFAFGGAVLCGLYLAPRSRPPVSPALPWAAPAGSLRFVSIDCAAGGDGAPSAERIIAAVRPLDADFVLLERVRSEDAAPLAEGLAMQRSFHPQCCQALGSRPRGPIGCLVLSKHPLYDARPLRRDGREAPCFGVGVIAVVDASRFFVGSAQLGDDAAPATIHDLSKAVSGGVQAPVVTGAAHAGIEPDRSAGFAAVAGSDGAGSIVFADTVWIRKSNGVVNLAPSTTAVWADLSGASGTIGPSSQGVR